MGIYSLTLAHTDDHVHQLVISGSYQTIEVWDVKEEEMIQVLEGHQDYVHTLLIHPKQQNHLISGSEDKTIK